MMAPVPQLPARMAPRASVPSDGCSAIDEPARPLLRRRAQEPGEFRDQRKRQNDLPRRQRTCRDRICKGNSSAVATS